MRKRNKNIYMGNNSTARLPIVGKVDTGNEICLNAMATAYDALNNKMLTRQMGVFDNTTLTEINSRFSILRMLARKHAPNKIVVVNKIYNVIRDHFKGHLSYSQAVSMLNEINMKYNNNPNHLNMAMAHVDHAEKISLPNAFGIEAFLYFANQNMNNKKHRGR